MDGSCPLCGLPLELKQINMSMAVYICVDVTCPYPVNDNCITVNRKLEDIKKCVKGDMKVEHKNEEQTCSYKTKNNNDKNGYADLDMGDFFRMLDSCQYNQQTILASQVHKELCEITTDNSKCKSTDFQSNQDNIAQEDFESSRPMDVDDINEFLNNFPI